VQITVTWVFGLRGQRARLENGHALRGQRPARRHVQCELLARHAQVLRPLKGSGFMMLCAARLCVFKADFQRRHGLKHHIIRGWGWRQSSRLDSKPLWIMGANLRLGCKTASRMTQAHIVKLERHALRTPPASARLAAATRPLARCWRSTPGWPAPAAGLAGSLARATPRGSQSPGSACEVQKAGSGSSPMRRVRSRSGSGIRMRTQY